MKIAVIFNNRLPTERAHGLQIVKMCSAFAGAGADIELIIPDIYNPIKDDIFAHYQVKKNFSINKKWCFNWQGNYRLRYLTFIISLLFSGISKDRFIFTRHPEVAFLFSRLGYKVIFEIHNWQKEKTRKNSFFLRKAFLIVSTTQIIKKEFIRNGFAPEKIIVAPNAVELKDFDLPVSQVYIREQLKIPQNKTIVLYSGHLYKQKGAETIIEAAKLLSYKYYFIFIGGLPFDVKNLKELANGRSNIDIRGPKKYIEVPFYLKAADILIVPNSGLDETESKYTSPLKLFEYLAAGKIIVASAVPAIKEFLNEKTAVLFKPDDASDLARVIEEISSDFDGQKEIMNNALLMAEKYTWQKRAEKIINYIKNHENMHFLCSANANRLEVIQKIIDKIKAKTYLEIGVEFGSTFSKINVGKKIAIDPIIKISWKRKLVDMLKFRKVKYFEMASDKFFNKYAYLFDKQKIDVMFVDGLHTYEQSLKDIENSLRFLNEKGIVVVHDCNPINEASASPSREITRKAGEKKWSGDVWKAIVHLRSVRSDLRIFTLDCDYGLGIIMKGTPENMLDYQPEQIGKMDYKDLADSRVKFLNLKDVNYFEEFLKTL